MDSLSIGPKIQTDMAPHQRNKNQNLDSEPEESALPKTEHKRFPLITNKRTIILREEIEKSPLGKKKFSEEVGKSMPIILEFSKKLKYRCSRFIEKSMLPIQFKLIKDLTYFDKNEDLDEAVEGSSTWSSKDMVGY